MKFPDNLWWLWLFTIPTPLAYASVVPPILLLRILNEFKLKKIHTPGAMRIGVEDQPAWKTFEARLRDDTPPEARVFKKPDEIAELLSRQTEPFKG